MEVVTENEVQAEIVQKGKVAPRITSEALDDAIASVWYSNGSAFEFEHGGVKVQKNAATERSLSCLTICVVVLKNGFTVTGESACASPENFDAEIGRKVSFTAARAKLWPLLGYCLRDKLHAQA
jgi:hypothetical protein